MLNNHRKLCPVPNSPKLKFPNTTNYSALSEYSPFNTLKYEGVLEGREYFFLSVQGVTPLPSEEGSSRG
jgi:hypothetical protein